MVYKKYLAPAKINLCLHVNSKRSDGYHELAMVMQTVSLYDELSVAISPRSGVRFYCETALGSHDDNLVVRAARAILAYDGLGRGVDLVLHKKIPVAAGLGGGSSDAATTLMALNDLLGLKLDREIVHKEALLLGADVPFFLYRPVAWARGIGDLLSPVKVLPPFWVVLVNPGVAVSTAQVYRTLTPVDYSSCSMAEVISTQTELVSLLHNSLERAAMNLCDKVGLLKDALTSLGSDGVLMSGSGATVFGIFFSHDEAQRAVKKLFEDYGYWARVVTPLT